MKWTWHVDLPPSGMAILLAVAVFLGYAVCTAVRMGQRVLSTQGLCKAAASGDAGAVHQALSAWGLDVNAGDGRRKCTPLIIAAAKGRGPVVGQLLAAGAAVDSADETGRTPLSFAAARGDGAVVGQLVAAGAAVDQANDNGSTPLWLAAGNGHAAMREGQHLMMCPSPEEGAGGGGERGDGNRLVAEDFTSKEDEDQAHRADPLGFQTIPGF